VPGTASEPPDLHPADWMILLVTVTNPPVAPGRVAFSARQIKVG